MTVQREQIGLGCSLFYQNWWSAKQVQDSVPPVNWEMVTYFKQEAISQTVHNITTTTTTSV